MFVVCGVTPDMATTYIATNDVFQDVHQHDIPRQTLHHIVTLFVFTNIYINFNTPNEQRDFGKDD